MARDSYASCRYRDCLAEVKMQMQMHLQLCSNCSAGSLRSEEIRVVATARMYRAEIVNRANGFARLAIYNGNFNSTNGFTGK
jgi:hypothetical protein